MGNVEVVRAAVQAFDSGDLDAMPAVVRGDHEWRCAFGSATADARIARGR